VADELGKNRAPAGPGLDDPLVSLAVHGLDFLHEAVDDVRPFFD
jgi:hypothetical protein